MQTSCESRSGVCIRLDDYGMENEEKHFLESYESLYTFKGVLGAEPTVTSIRYGLIFNRRDSSEVDKMFRTIYDENDAGSGGSAWKSLVRKRENVSKNKWTRRNVEGAVDYSSARATYAISNRSD